MKIFSNFFKLGSAVLIFFLILSAVSVGFAESTHAAESLDFPKDKTEAEIEKEVNDFIAEQEEKKEKKNDEDEITTTATDPFSQCVANKVSAEYAEILKFAAVSTAFNHPSWANFKKAAKELVNKGFKGSVVGIAYNLFTAYEECQGAGQIA